METISQERSMMKFWKHGKHSCDIPQSTDHDTKRHTPEDTMTNDVQNCLEDLLTIAALFWNVSKRNIKLTLERLIVQCTFFCFMTNLSTTRTLCGVEPNKLKL